LTPDIAFHVRSASIRLGDERTTAVVTAVIATAVIATAVTTVITTVVVVVVAVVPGWVVGRTRPRCVAEVRAGSARIPWVAAVGAWRVTEKGSPTANQETQSTGQEQSATFVHGSTSVRAISTKVH
jgi:hypothetical protein